MSNETKFTPEHSFVQIRGGRLAYAKYGKIATYSNIAQAEKKLAELMSIGFDCYRKYDRPFFILLNQEQPKEDVFETLATILKPTI